MRNKVPRVIGSARDKVLRVIGSARDHQKTMFKRN